ncbi:Crp/Fnr family transcriptional regulator [Chryseolinea sp. T2]|uniref:Crp/Fnr family transcriptional regulator n=1 Tax=Chryseolinea sp. T2 TaxID=3129255 RepID=UPI0030789E46
MMLLHCEKILHQGEKRLGMQDEDFAATQNIEGTTVRLWFRKTELTVKAMYQPILDYLSKYIELTDTEAERFKSFLKHRKLRKRQYLLQAGDVSTFETFVAGGCLRSYSVEEDGTEHIVQFAIENWWIGDLYSFLSGAPATLNIDAIEDSDVFTIDKSDLERLYREIPKFERMFRILFQNAFVAYQQRILSKISQTAEEQYIEFIGKYASIEQRVPQHQIASYLGMSAETISRIRKQQSKH